MPLSCLLLAGGGAVVYRLLLKIPPRRESEGGTEVPLLDQTAVVPVAVKEAIPVDLPVVAGAPEAVAHLMLWFKLVAAFELVREFLPLVRTFATTIISIGVLLLPTGTYLGTVTVTLPVKIATTLPARSMMAFIVMVLVVAIFITLA